jgi:hypothetical protein
MIKHKTEEDGTHSCSHMQEPTAQPSTNSPGSPTATAATSTKPTDTTVHQDDNSPWRKQAPAHEVVSTAKTNASEHPYQQEEPQQHQQTPSTDDQQRSLCIAQYQLTRQDFLATYMMVNTVHLPNNLPPMRRWETTHQKDECLSDDQQLAGFS